jgi:hypothetical protein
MRNLEALRKGGDEDGLPPVYDMYVKGTDHQNFCDVSVTAGRALLRSFSVIGPAPPQLAMEAIDSLVISFFLRELRMNLSMASSTGYAPPSLHEVASVNSHLVIDENNSPQLPTLLIDSATLNREAVKCVRIEGDETDRLIRRCFPLSPLISSTWSTSKKKKYMGDIRSPSFEYCVSEPVINFIRASVFPASSIANTFDRSSYEHCSPIDELAIQKH